MSIFNNPCNCNPVNRFLWFFNPKIPLPGNHYTCGANLAIFSSLAQIESCLSNVTNNCKSIISNSPKLLRDSKDNIDTSNNMPPNKSR